jgi:flagellar M-ring protein FliF
VDGIAEPQEGGPPRWRERTPEELQRIATLVRSAVGFDERRGDRVEVVSMRFAEEASMPPEQAGFLGLPIAPVLGTRLTESALLALVALAAILLIGRPMAGRIAASLAPVPALAGPDGALPEDAAGMAAGGGTAQLAAGPGGAALPPGANPAAVGDPESLITLANVQGQMRASSIRSLTELVEQHPDEAVSVLRRWLNPEDAS